MNFRSWMFLSCIQETGRKYIPSVCFTVKRDFPNHSIFLFQIVNSPGFTQKRWVKLSCAASSVGNVNIPARPFWLWHHINDINIAKLLSSLSPALPHLSTHPWSMQSLFCTNTEPAGLDSYSSQWRNKAKPPKSKILRHCAANWNE